MTRSRWDDVLADAAAGGYRVAKAVPRGTDHLLLDLLRTGPGGAGVASDGPRAVAAQWFSERDRASAVARDSAASGARAVGRLVVHRPGADRRLRALSGLLDRPGARLVAHRPERRAVVRHQHDGRTVFTKVVRAGRAQALAGTLDVLGRSGVPVPAVLAVDDEQGLVTLSALPGRTLHELLGDPRSGLDDLRAAGERTGRVLRRLHAVPVDVAGGGSPATHDGPAEVAVLRRWLALAEAFGTLAPDGRLTAQADRVEDALAGRPAGHVLLHRDLHDKQVLLDPAGGAGVLDLDLLAAGDPALDLANLLVHLDLRVLQGHCGAPAADAVRDGLLAGYDPDPAVRPAVPAYALAARLRLRAVYSFRPGGAAAALALPLASEDPVAGATGSSDASKGWRVGGRSADTLSR